MQRIILDTNIIVSSLIQKNYPYLIVYDCIERNAKLCLSSSILQEYIGVLGRPKFAKFTDFKANADFLIARLTEMAEFHEPITRLNVISDEPDNRFLELAQASQADYIITGNTNDFRMNSYKQTKIVTPKEYWENYKV